MVNTASNICIVLKLKRKSFVHIFEALKTIKKNPHFNKIRKLIRAAKIKELINIVAF